MKKITFLSFLLFTFFTYNSYSQCTDSHTAGSSSTTAGSYGQSFQPTSTGTLNTIGYISLAGHTGLTATLYSGDGTGGTQLAQLTGQSITAFGTPTDFKTFDFSGAAITLTSGVTSVAGTGFTLNTDIDKAGTIYYVVLADAATAPSSAEVKAGTASGGGTVVTSGNAAVSTGGFTNDFSVTSLTAGTAYDVYTVAEDDEGTPNLQASPTKIDVTTPTPSEITYSGAGFSENPANDGSVTGSINATLTGDSFASNPLIVGTDVTLGNVPTGLTPSITTTTAGTDWTARVPAEANFWTSVTYGNGVYVAVAFNGTNVMTSPDGITWTARAAAEANGWNEVTYGNGLFVAVAGSGTNRVMTSPDGITWTARTASEANDWYSVTYGNGLFVAVSRTGTNLVMTSPDGITWTARAAAEANNWRSVTYGGGLFVAVAATGTNLVMTSPDGITWTARVAAEANQWYSVTYGNGLFVALAADGTNRVMTSSDGIIWTARAATEANQWRRVTYGNGLFVAVAQSGTNRVMTSPDGITWTARTAAEANSWFWVTYGNGLFVAVSFDGTNQVMTSETMATLSLSGNATNHLNTDDVADITFDFSNSAFTGGSASTVVNATGPASSNLGVDFLTDPEITYGGTGFTENPANDGSVTGSIDLNLTGDSFASNPLIVGTDVTLGNIPTGLTPSITTTTAGTDWTARMAAEANSWASVTYGNGLYVAVAFNGTNRVMTSPDGITWTARAAAEANDWYSVTYGNGLFVAVSINGTNRVMTSPDGIIWTARTAAEANGWFSVTYGNGLFVAVSFDGTNRVMTSPDGITWTTRAAAENNSWSSVTYGNELFVAVAGTGTNRVMTSLDGIIWTARTAAEANEWTEITYGNGLFVAVSSNGTNQVMTSPDGISWTARMASEDNFWTSVVYGNGLFVAVAYQSSTGVMTSADGITWAARTIPEANRWESITYNNGLFVAVAVNGANRVMTSETMATLSLSGNATNHLNTDDVADITFDFSNSAFTGSSASAVVNATGPASSNLGVDFTQNPEITYSGAGFTENPANDGSVTGSIDLNLTGDSFASNPLIVGTDVTLGNIPTGLTPSIAATTAGTDWTARMATEANRWTRVTYGNGLFVAVASTGTNRVMTSPDGITWTARTAAEANNWLSVTYGNGLFVAVASTGTNRVMTSPDGITWTVRTAAEANSWRSVTYGNGLFVAVAATGTNLVMTSPDGITWTARTATEANSWRSVIYENGLFVAVSINGTNRVMTSPDGITWTARTAAEASGWTSVTYGNGLFVAVAQSGANRVMTSPDGVTWTARMEAEANNWNSITYGNGLFVAVASTGTNRVMTSPDGITWTARMATEDNTWISITSGNGQFVALSFDGVNRIMTSETMASLSLSGNATNHLNTDDVADITFDFANSAFTGGSASVVVNATGPASSNLGVDFLTDPEITYGGTGFTENPANDGSVTGSIDLNLTGDSFASNPLIVGTDVSLGNIPTGLTPSIAATTAGTDWTARMAAEANSWASVTYGNGLYVAVAFNGTNRVMTSPDGITWTARAAAEANDWYSVTYGNGLFVAVSINGTNRVMTSPDGITWTARTAAEANGWFSVTYGNGLFVAVSFDGTNRVMTSPDGITWTTRAAAENNSWSSVTYGNELFVAVAGTGTNRVMTSLDGITWTARTAAEANEWTEITYGNGLFVAVSSNGTNRVMTSPDGISWTARMASEDNFWTSVVYGNGLFVAVAFQSSTGVMTSADGITWAARTIPEANRWESITYNNGLFVAVASTGTNHVMTSETMASLSLSGNATNHLNTDDVADITFDFANSAFTGGSASVVVNATGPASSNLGVDFLTDPEITYGGTGFTENPANDGSVTGSIDLNLTGDSFASNPLIVGTDVSLGNIPTGLTPSIAATTAGTDWTARMAAEANSWASVTYGNGLYVAVAFNGTNRVMTSPDGITWTARAAAEANDWYSVTYGNGLFVAVSINGTNRVMTSPDGITWTARTAAEANGWFSVTYGNGLFVAVSFDGTNRVMTSPDGITWTTRAAAENNSWSSVTYGNELFVAVAGTGTNRVMTSLDGIIWTARTAAEANEWTEITYGNGLFVAVSSNGTNQVMTSPDGISWTARMASEDNFWTSVVYGNGLFVAVAFQSSTGVMTSADGITWTARTIPEANRWESITYNNGLFVAVASTGTNHVMTSETMASLSLSGNATNHLNTDDVADITFDFANSAFTGGSASVVVNATGPASSNLGVDFLTDPEITYSGAGFSENPANDGSVTGSIDLNLTGDSFASNPLIVGTDVSLGNIPTGLTPSIAATTAGTDWTARMAAEANSWASVTYGNGLYVAVAFNGTNRVMTSPDGITWTARAAAEANDWYSVTYGNGLFVAVSINGTNRVMTSPDGITWTARTAAEANGWFSVTYGNGLFVAVSFDGTNRVMTSPDGITWTTRAAAENNSWSSVTYGNELFVAVAGTGTNRVMTSLDGIIWTARTAAEANEWTEITYGNGLFVAVSSNGTNQVMTSPDGISWTARMASEDNFWTSVVYGNGLFVAVAFQSSTGVMTSADGITWAARTIPEANRWESITYNNGLFVAVASTGTNHVMTSETMASLSLSGNATNHLNTDDVADITFDFANSAFTGGSASTVVNATGPASSNLGVDFLTDPEITYGGTGFTENPANDGSVTGSIDLNLTGDSFASNPLIVGTDVTLGNIPPGLTPSLTTNVGADWTARMAAESNSWTSVTYGNGMYVAVAGSGTNRVMTSPDGVTWTARTAAESNNWVSVTYGNGLFVAVARSGTNRVMTSPDGITWTARAITDNNDWFTVTYGNGLFVAVSRNGTNRVMTSPDGITWTARPAAAASDWRSVTYGGGLFVAVAFGGTNRVMTSPDGITWTARTAAEANFWNSVTYGNGLFVAVAQTGANRVMTSPDGVTWTARMEAEANGWNSITYGNGQFVAVSFDGTNQVMTSPDGSTWTARTAAEANGWFWVTYGNGQFVAVAGTGTNRVMTSETMTTLSLSGNATNHDNANDIADITFDFANSAFTGGSASAVTSATGPASSNLGVDFEDAPEITYSGSGFTENPANDGSVSGSIDLSLAGDSFASNPLIVGTHVTLGNIPTGLTPSITTTTAGTDWTARMAAEANSWASVTYGNGLYVAVAFNGTNRVMTSPDGITWTARAAAEANDWYSVTYGNGLFVAVSINGTNRVMTSPDGITWTARTAAEANGWFSVTYGNGLFVAVSFDGTNRVMTSPDGITWTARAAAENNSWSSVTYDNGLFVAVSASGTNRVMTSLDGITWTARTAAEANEWTEITYGNGLFVAVSSNGTNQVMTSPDGITWTARMASEDNFWTSVVYGNGLFVAVAYQSSTGVMTSADGITWTARTIPEANRWESITYNNGQFVAVANTGANRVMTSETMATLSLSGNATNHLNTDDVADITFDFANSAFTGSSASAVVNATGPASSNLGVDFTQNPEITYSGAGFTENPANDGSVSGSIDLSLAGDSFASNPLIVGTHVTLGNIPTGLTPSITTITTAGTDWTARTAAENNSWESITYGNGLYVAVAFNGTNRVMTSPDGSTWTARIATEGNIWTSVTYGNGLFVAVSSDGTNRVMTSPDGITWTARTAAEANNWRSVTYGDGQFVAVASSGTNRVMTSPDGITWTARMATEANFWLSVTYGNGLFVAVAQNGTNRVMTSPDGITWTARAASEANNWNSVTYGNGLFVAVAQTGANRVMTSPDGVTWTARMEAEANGWNSITYGNGQFVAVSFHGTNRVMTSPDGSTWTARTAAEANGWTSITYGNGQFVAVAGSGTNRVMTSATMASLSLSGNATNHQDTNDVSDITFNFSDIAFTGGSASAVTNATGPASSNLGVDFNDPNAPTFTSSPVTSVNEGDTYTYNITTNDVDGDVVTVSASTLPSWLTLDAVNVTTFAGTAGVSGSADGNGTAASFNGPSGMTVDASGNLYVVDALSHIIRKIAPNGDVTTIAGTAGVSGSADGNGPAASFFFPNSITVDATGNLYVTDQSNQLIRKIAPNGDVTTIAGSGSVASVDGNGTAASFNNPGGIIIDISGNLYVTDVGGQTIRKIAPNGDVTTIAGMAGETGSTDGNGTAARFNFPVGITIDASDNLYVTEVENHLIRKIAPNGDVTTFAGTVGVAGSANGNGTAASFNSPVGITIDASGNLYVTDSQSNTIRKIASNGDVTTIAGMAGVGGSTNGSGSAATFLTPIAITVDTAGTIYIADRSTHLVRTIAPSTSVQLTGNSTGQGGMHPVVLEANDGNGGATAQQSFTITVNDITAPTGYSVSIDQDPINGGNDNSVSFTFAAAEVGATYNYTFSTSGGAGTVTGSGTIATATDNITGIDLSGLADGTITLSVTLTDPSSNVGGAVTDTSTKETVAPTGYSVTINQAPINTSNQTAVGFTFAAAEVGATYDYTFSTSGGAGTITGSGTIATATDNITGVDLSGLADGTITLSVTLTDVNDNAGSAVTDTSTKETIAPTGYSVTIDQDPINTSNHTAVSFTFASAEVGATYNYTFSTSGGAGTVTGSGTVATVTDNITGTDLSGITDGTITLSVTLTDTNGNVGSAVADTSTKNTIANIVVNDPTVTEGNSGTVTLQYTVSLESVATSTITVDVATSDGTAVSSSDYTAQSTTTLTFMAGETAKTVDVTVNGDTALEADETINLDLTNATGPSVITDATGVGTITNDDSAAVTIANVSGNEDNETITVIATLDNAVQGGFTVDVSTADGTATIADNDYTAVTSQTLTFAGTVGETQTFTVLPTTDLKLEADETVTISQSNLAATNLSVDISDGATATINNDDAAAVTIEDVAIVEDGGTVTLTATLDNAVQGGFTVDVSTVDITARSASDYTAIAGQTLTFAGTAGESQVFDVVPTNDAVEEAIETLSVSQGNLAATALTVTITDRATVTITDDDDNTAPIGYTVSFDDALIGDAETSTSTFTFAGAEVGTTYNYTVSSDGGGTDVTGTGTITTATDQVTLANLSGLTDGTLTISVTLTDPSSNVGPVVTATTTLDKTAPTGPVVSSITTDSGIDGGDGITNDNTPDVNGTAEANSTVEVFIDGSSVGITTADGSGNWTMVYNGSSPADDGALAVTAKSTDVAGNTSLESGALNVIIDTTAPTAPVVSSITDDTGSNGADGITNDNTVSFNGTADANSTVELFTEGVSIGTTTADGSGNFSFDYSGTVLSDGMISITANAIDAAGNTSIVSAALRVTVDTATPGAPTVDLSSGSDLGISSTDDLTSDATPTIEGTAEANSTVEVFVGGSSVGTVSADMSGDWIITPSTAFGEGESVITAMATDAAGNTSGVSSSLSVTIDTSIAAPGLSPADNAVDILPDANLMLTFVEDVNLGTGNITIKQSSDDSVLETIDITSSNVTINAGVVTIDPTNLILPPATEFYVNVDAGTFTDDAGNAFAGITSTTDWSFTIIAASTVSSVTVPANATYMIGDELDIVVNMILPVTVTGIATIPVTIGSTVVNATQVGTVTNSSTITFRYTVVENDLDADGIAVGLAINLNDGTMRDEFDVDAILTLNNVGVTTAVLVDGVKPTPVISSDAVALVNGTYSATVTFDEVMTVSSFTLADITVVNGTASNLVNTIAGIVWTVDIAPTADGTVTVSLAANTATDVAGNDNNASNSLSRNFDGTAPEVASVNRIDTDPLNTGDAEADFRVIFTEEVTGVDLADLEVILTASATGTLNTITAVDAKIYDVNVNGIGGQGTIGLNVKADDSIIDAATNPLAAAFTGQVYTTNFTPTDIGLSAIAIDENNALIATVATLSTTDADTGDAHTYSLVAGTNDTDNGSFAISGTNLTTNNISFNFEADASYDIRLKTDDGKGGLFEKAFIITVNDVNEVPISLSLTNNTIDEADLAQDVGTLISLDQDGGETFTYSLITGTGDTDNAEFAISGSTLRTAGLINFEDGATRRVLVRVTDSGGLTLDQQFTINIGEIVIEPLREFTTNTTTATVKNVFSPNGDGVNETWVIEDLQDNPINTVKVYAQGGKLIYSQDNYQNDWGGTFKGNPIPAGTYYYEINVYNGERIIKGFLTIIRNR